MAISVLELSAGSSSDNSLTPFVARQTQTPHCGFFQADGAELQDGDLLVFIHTFDAINAFATSSPGTAGVADTHPAASTMQGTFTSGWKDMGYQRQSVGSGFTSRLLGCGIYVRPIDAATDDLDDITMQWDSGVSASFWGACPTTARAMVVRGLDVSVSHLGNTQTVTLAGVEVWANSNSVKWAKPNSGSWSSANFPETLLPIHVACQERAQVVNPASTPSEGGLTLNNLTSDAVSTWNVPGNPATEDLTDPNGFASSIQNHGIVTFYKTTNISDLDDGWDTFAADTEYWAFDAGASGTNTAVTITLPLMELGGVTYTESVSASATFSTTPPAVTPEVTFVTTPGASATLADTVPVATNTVDRVFSEAVSASATLASTPPVSTGPVTRPVSTSASATFAATVPTATGTVDKVFSESVSVSATLADAAPTATFVATFAPSVSASASFAITIVPEVTFVPTVDGVSASFATTPPVATGSAAFV